MSATTTIQKETPSIKNGGEIKQLQLKARIFDDFLEIIEDQYFGRLMKLTENEPDISISEAKKLMR